MNEEELELLEALVKAIEKITTQIEVLNVTVKSLASA